MEEKHIFKGFLYFYKKKYNQSYTYSDQSQRLCKRFIELLVEQYEHIDVIGESFLWNYFVYQFQYWSELDIKSFNKRINLSFIIGEKAFKRYLSRNQEFDWQIEQDSRTYSRKEFAELLSLPQHTEEGSKYDPDDYYREKFLNEEKGLSNCLVYTSLFEPSSNYCSQCKFKEECKDSQKELYPHIYKERNKIVKSNNGTTNTK